MLETKETTKAVDNGARVEPSAGGASIAPADRAGGPFELMRRFAEEMDRLFEQAGRGRGFHLPGVLTRGRELFRREAGLIPADWSPAIDVFEREGRFVVKADLPGLAKDEIEVDVDNGAITIRGERKREERAEHEGYAYSECSYGGFYRVIPLPERADASNAAAEFRDGVLEVHMPMVDRPESKPRRLSIQSGQ